MKVDYQSLGSGAGIKGITERTVHFGATDAPLSDAHRKDLPGNLLTLPAVGGALVVAFNLPGVQALRLDEETLAAIYLMEIRNWNDPRVSALKPGVRLPDRPIITVHRSDGAGTNYVFTDYLSKISATWAEKVGRGTAVNWPGGIAAPKSDEIAGPIRNIVGAVGYVELAFARNSTPPLPFAILLNDERKEVEPSGAAVLAAAESSAKTDPGALLASVCNAPDPGACPLYGYTYILVYKDLSYMKDRPVALETVKFLEWCLTGTGPDMAEPNGYAKLPEPTQELILQKTTGSHIRGESAFGFPRQQGGEWTARVRSMRQTSQYGP